MDKVQRSGGHRVFRVHWCGLLEIGCLSLAARTFAADQPIVLVGPHALAPQRLDVHVGELIRWRAAGGEDLHLRLDAHPGAHEAVVRSGEIRAVFLLPGVHRTRSS